MERGGVWLAWSAERRGEQAVAVRVGGEHVKGSPLLLSVARGALAAARCKVHGGPRRLVAGEAAQAAVAGEALQLVAGELVELRVSWLGWLGLALTVTLTLTLTLTLTR